MLKPRNSLQRSIYPVVVCPYVALMLVADCDIDAAIISDDTHNDDEFESRGQPLDGNSGRCLHSFQAFACGGL